VAEAVAKTQRIGSELGRSVETIRSSTRSLIEELRQIDPHVAAAMRAVAATEEVFRRGGTVAREQAMNYDQLTAYLRGKGMESVQQSGASPELVNALQARIVGLPSGPVTTPGPSTPAHAVDDSGWGVPLPGTVPSSTGRGGGAVVPSGRGGGGAVPSGGRDEEQKEINETRHRLDDERRARNELLLIEQKSAEVRRVEKLDNKELTEDWKRKNREIREQGREMERLGRFRDLDKAGLLGKRERWELGRMEKAEIPETMRFLEMQQAVMRAEGASRGMQMLPDGRVVMPDGSVGGGGREIGRSFMHGAGMGRWMRAATPAGAAALAGYGAYRLFRAFAGDYRGFANAVRGQESLARATGGAMDPDIWLGATIPDLMARYRVFDEGQIIAASNTLGRGLGMGAGFLDPLNSVMRGAVLTGRSPQEQAAASVRLMMLQGRMDPGLTMSVLAGFGTSPFGGRVSSSGNIDMTLMPFYEQALQQVSAGTTGPYTFADVGGVGAMLAGMAPALAGVDPQSRQGIQLATNMLMAQNRSMRSQGDVFDDISRVAVMKLRGNADLQARLGAKGIDIDLNTITGIGRAIERAPELAQKGIPEVREAILRARREAFPDPEMLQLALIASGRASSYEEAYRVTTAPIHLAAARFGLGGPGLSLGQLSPQERDALNSEAVKRIEDLVVTPGRTSLVSGMEVRGVGDMFASVTATMHELKEEVATGRLKDSIVDAIERMLGVGVDNESVGP